MIPVLLLWLGRSRWFRHEVRRWHNGTIPDASHAVGSPRRLGATAPRPDRSWNRRPRSRP
jgi:hypothetical protein